MCIRDRHELEIAILEVISQIERSNLLRGFVWTQLTDVQQEINGLLFFDRKPKIALEKIKKIMTRPNIEARQNNLIKKSAEEAATAHNPRPK